MNSMIRFEKMTVKAQEALQSAQEVAARHENQQIEPIHLLAALVAQTDGVVPPLLARLGSALNSFRRTSNAKLAVCRKCGFRPAAHEPGVERSAGARVRGSRKI